jgi:hypothetical protein
MPRILPNVDCARADVAAILIAHIARKIDPIAATGEPGSKRSTTYESLEIIEWMLVVGANMLVPHSGFHNPLRK